MNRVSLLGRLAAVIGLVALLALATAAPVLPAAPDAGTISTGTAEVWNGHSCPANVPLNIAGLGAGMGGYETRLTWPASRFSSADADITIGLTPYLTNGGTRNQTGDSGTPALKATGTDTVKFGAYSWGTGNPAGNSANGQLATVGIKPTATCGAAALTLSETQLVDINGTVIALTAQTGSSVSVFSRYDTTGSGPLINASDVAAVVSKLNQSVGGTCGANYRYDTTVSGPLINASDVSAVVGKLNQSTTAACTS